MKCRVRNPKCDGKGNIMVSDFTYAHCTCTHIRKAEERYLNHGGNKRHMKFPTQLQDMKTIVRHEDGNKKKHSFIGTLKETVHTLPTLVRNQTKLHLVGKPGRGKTQFAYSLLLLGFYYNFKCFAFDLRNARAVIKNDRKLEELQKQMKNADILLLDDVGVEASGDWQKQDASNFIDWCVRQHEGLLVLTSNVFPSKAELENVYDDARLIDALLEEPKQTLIFTGDNLRGENHE